MGVVEEISDAELEELALAADPDDVIGDDAVPWLPDRGAALLPSWYMGSPGSSGGGRGRRGVVALVISSLLLVNAVGLCVTYGYLQIA